MGVWGATPIGSWGSWAVGDFPLCPGDWATHTLLSDNGEKTRQIYRRIFRVFFSVCGLAFPRSELERQSQRIKPRRRRIGAGHEHDRATNSAQDAAETAVGRVHDRFDGEVG